MEAPLTPEEDKLLRRQTKKLFINYLVELLGGDDDSYLCTGGLYIPYAVFKRGTVYTNQNPNDPSIATRLLTNLILTMDEFDNYLKGNKETSEVTEIADSFLKQNEDTVEILNTTLDECKKRFFILSVALIPIGSLSGHQTVIIFDKEKKKCIAIDPEGYIRTFRTLCELLLERMAKSDYELVEQREQCVQAVAKDNNCMFWSLLLVANYMQGIFTSIDQVSASILKENPPPEELKVYVEGFKSRLFRQKTMSSEVIPPAPRPFLTVLPPSRGAPVLVGGKKTKGTRTNAKGGKWVASTESRSHRRSRRLLRRHPQKSRSRHSRNARRTQRRV